MDLKDEKFYTLSEMIGGDEESPTAMRPSVISYWATGYRFIEKYLILLFHKSIKVFTRGNGLIKIQSRPFFRGEKSYALYLNDERGLYSEKEIREMGFPISWKTALAFLRGDILAEDIKDIKQEE